MSYTKQQFVEGAFEEIGMASYTYDLSSEDLQFGLRRLDAMLAEWNGKGIRLSYPIPATPAESSLSTVTGVPDSANEAIITNLAIRISPSFGKQVLRETKIVARQGYNTLLSRGSNPPEMQMPATMPRGAGQKAWRSNIDPFVSTPTDPVAAGQDGELDFY